MEPSELDNRRILKDIEQVQALETSEEKEAFLDGVELGIRIGQMHLQDALNMGVMSATSLEAIRKSTRLLKESINGRSSAVPPSGEAH